MKVFIDADACPVKNTIITVASEYNIPVVLVKSYAHFSHDEEATGVETIYVDQGSDAADFRIIQLVKPDDIVITQDFGLASLALAKNCIVLHHKGFRYNQGNIDQLLQQRYLSAKARKSGQRTKGPKPFTKEDESKFASLLHKTISDHI